MILNQYKSTLLVSLILLNLTFVFEACCAKKQTKVAVENNLIKACPEEWYQNKMPGPDKKESSAYFIYEGQRRELKEFDMEWINKNCNIKPQIVQ